MIWTIISLLISTVMGAVGVIAFNIGQNTVGWILITAAVLRVLIRIIKIKKRK